MITHSLKIFKQILVMITQFENLDQIIYYIVECQSLWIRQRDLNTILHECAL
eukprot:UN22659